VSRACVCARALATEGASEIVMLPKVVMIIMMMMMMMVLCNYSLNQVLIYTSTDHPLAARIV